MSWQRMPDNNRRYLCCFFAVAFIAIVLTILYYLEKNAYARWDVERLNEMAVLCSGYHSDLWEKYWMQAN